MKHRPLRIANLIQEELGALIARELEFPDALVTITRVDVDDKMETARVGVSVIPFEETAQALTALRGSQPRLQHLLLKKINIKPMPRIQFEIDRGSENAARVEKILLKDNN